MLALAAALAVAGAACGSDDGSGGAVTTPSTGDQPGPTDPVAADTTTPAETTPDSVPMSDTNLPIISSPSGPPKKPTDSFSPITLRGRITVGATAGCLELVTEGGRYALVADPATDLAPGVEVEVIGLPAPQLQLPCDGTPLQVSQIRPL